MKGRMWREADKACLRLMWPWVPHAEIAAFFGVSTRAISCLVQRLELPRRRRVRPWRRAFESPQAGRSYRVWTEAEDDVLRKWWLTRNVRAIATSLRTTASAIRNRAWQLGLTPRVRHWTTAEEKLLRSRYGRMTAIQLSVLLGRDAQAVRQRAMQLRKRQVGAIAKGAA